MGEKKEGTDAAARTICRVTRKMYAVLREGWSRPESLNRSRSQPMKTLPQDCVPSSVALSAQDLPRRRRGRMLRQELSAPPVEGIELGSRWFAPLLGVSLPRTDRSAVLCVTPIRRLISRTDVHCTRCTHRVWRYLLSLSSLPASSSYDGVAAIEAQDGQRGWRSLRHVPLAHCSTASIGRGSCRDRSRVGPGIRFGVRCDWLDSPSTRVPRTHTPSRGSRFAHRSVHRIRPEWEVPGYGRCLA
jgi:hypothetical protein